MAVQNKEVQHVKPGVRIFINIKTNYPYENSF